MKKLLLGVLIFSSGVAHANDYTVTVHRNAAAIYGAPVSAVVVTVTTDTGYEPSQDMKDIMKYGYAKTSRERFNKWFESKDFYKMNPGYKRNACTDMGYGFYDCAVQELD